MSEEIIIDGVNTAVIRLTNCQDCQYCDHNGMLQSNPKYLCRNNKVYGRNKVNAKYWYDQPILAPVNSKTGKQIDIPDWCPYNEGHDLLEKV